MAYYSGSVNDIAALRSALVDACVLEGWAWDSATEVLSKSLMFLHLQVASGRLYLTGRTTPSGGGMPSPCQIGGIPGLHAIAYPLGYELFLFPDEVYCVVRHSVDVFQYFAFGRSSIPLPGTGMWVGATGETGMSGSSGLSIYPAGGTGVNYGYTVPALFWATDYSRSNNVHSDFDGQGWWLDQAASANAIGISPLIPLTSLLPNAWNSEAVLLPIRAFKRRASGKVSLVVDLSNARHTRVDNYLPGEVITIGTDRWKVFPWYRKNSAARNGGSGITHSGTFGWAIRYEGP